MEPRKLIHQWGVAWKGGYPVCHTTGNSCVQRSRRHDRKCGLYAEHALFLMLGLARRIHVCFKAFHTGLWGAPVGEALTGNTALVVGLGRVGKALAGKLSALGMNVHAIRRTPDLAAEKSCRSHRPGICRICAEWQPLRIS